MNSTIKELRNFYKGKKVFVTGHTGFKGSWLISLLSELGAEVVGASILADDNLLYRLLDVDSLNLRSHFIDIRDRYIVELIQKENPDILFHLAAQPIVSVGYEQPYLTYSSNVLGTVNVLDGVRALNKKVSVVNVTTDKVYRNYEKSEGYSEGEELGGSDPYASSKSCSELVTFSYNESFFKDSEKIVSTARAGNVIGGGDFADNRIVPDLYRGMKNRTPVSIRNFDSVRPYEHVLDALFAYVILAKEQYEDPKLRGEYNIGPSEVSLMKTREIVDFFSSHSSDISIEDLSSSQKFHETNILKLNSNKFRETFNWKPKWESKEDILNKTFDWYYQYNSGYNAYNLLTEQIKEFLNVEQ